MELRGTLSDIDNGFMAFVKTFLDFSYPDHHLHFPEKKIYRKDHTTKKGGGLLCVISDNLEAKTVGLWRSAVWTWNDLVEVEDSDTIHSDLQCVQASRNECAEDFGVDGWISECFADSRHLGLEFVVLGDLNIDLHRTTHGGVLRDFMPSMNLSDCVLGPTRVGSNRVLQTTSSTKIDYCLTNRPNSY